MKENLEKLIILLLILLSGSSYFDYKTLIYPLLFILVIYLIFYKQKNIKLSKYNFIIVYIFIVVLGIQVLFTSGTTYPIKDIGHILLYLLIMALLQSNMLKSSFIRKYINIMLVICLVSLACLFLVNILGMDNLPLAKSMVAYDGLSSRDATPYFTIRIFNQWGLIDQQRNSGLFWEPGAFQAFINLAILFLITNLKEIRKPDAIKLLILIITLLTTQSLTGYIILALLMLYLGINFKGINPKRKLSLLFLLIVISCIVAVNFQSIYDLIDYKLISQNGSYTTRMEVDTVGGFQLFLDKPILGYGYNSDYLKTISSAAGIVNNSNGIIVLLLNFGLLIGIPYLVFFSKGIKSFYQTSKIYRLLISVIFLIIHSTEWFLLTPIFLSFLFRWQIEVETIQVQSTAIKNQYQLR